jgi:protein involved in plasmid replication-relaxation
MRWLRVFASALACDFWSLGVCRSVVCDRQARGPRIWLASAETGGCGRARLFYRPIPCNSLRASPVLTAALAGPSLMTHRASGRNRVVCDRGADRGNAPLTDLDQRVLTVLCAHRVVRTDQLERLFPDVPERTLRYRTRRLHDLGLAGRSRPYRERGSAPNHHWPTRRADCLMRGDPVPRGGERKQPNPVFIAHATALTEFYVTLTTRINKVGLAVQEYRREAQAREAFTHLGKDRALAPDAMVILVGSDGRQFGAFVEIDLGTMSHTRLRQKAELYAAYTESDAWHGRHLFLPALLFLTTTDIRAGKFLKALARMLAHGPRSKTRRAFTAGAAGVAWAPHQLLDPACLMDLDGRTGLALTDVLGAARSPYEKTITTSTSPRRSRRSRAPPRAARTADLSRPGWMPRRSPGGCARTRRTPSCSASPPTPACASASCFRCVGRTSTSTPAA